MKPFLFWTFLIIYSVSAQAQVINGRYWNPIRDYFAWDFGRFNFQLTAPNLKNSTDSGSIAFKDNKFWGRNDTGWVSLSDISTPSLGSTHIDTTGSYTIPDSVNNVILQYAGGTSITLPDPAAYDKREITIRNVSGNGATFNYELVYSAGNSSDELATGKWVRIKSDGTDWRVTQESGSEGGGGGIIIDNF